VVESELALALDHCLDRFLIGQDWRAALPENDLRAQVQELMQVAELVMGSARRTPGMKPPEKERLLSRLRSRLLEIRTPAPTQSPAAEAAG
jgi:hypothetical protein